MSMISGLIDELRKSADEWNGSNMFELARMCSEAADTIWQLRDDLQRANAAVQEAEHDESMAWDRVRKAEAENTKLREQMERLVTLLRVDCDIEASWDGLRKFWSIELTDGGCLMRDRVCKGEAKNAKLRELVRGLHMAYVGALNECESMDSGLIWDHCEMVDAELAKSHVRFEADRHRFDAAMNELEIEVNE